MTVARHAVSVAGVLAFAAIATSATTARGDDHRSVIVWADGAGGEQLASQVASHLSAPYSLGAGGAFRRALASGRAPSLAAAAKDHAADAKLVASARAAARAVHADAAILLQARTSKRGTVVHVWLVDPNGDGAAEVDREVALGPRASVDEEANAAWGTVAGDLPSRSAPQREVAAAPPRPPPERAEEATVPQAPPAMPSAATGPDTEQEPPANDSAPPPPRETTRSNALAAIRAAIQMGSRDFSYVDRLTSTLRPYTLLAAPMAAVDAEIYPCARSGTPVLEGFGATFDYAMAFGLSSTDSAGTSVSTQWNSFDLGARERIPIGRSLILGLHGGYGEINYTFDGALSTTAELPGAQYRFLRGGLDARVAMGAFSLYAYGSYLDVLSTGVISTYFARSTVGGAEGRLGLARTLGHGFDLSLELAYTRFFYTLNPQPGDAYVAGGALDQMAQGSLGASYVF